MALPRVSTFMFTASAAVMLSVFWPSDAAWALRVPRPLATDDRIFTVMYSQNEVYKFVGHYGFQSSIELAPDETIATISIGDSTAWSVSPSGSRIFLKPTEQNALTNMTVVTDKRVYHFELHPKESDDIRSKDMMFVLRFQYPDTEAASVSGVTDPVPNVDDLDDPSKYNFNYSLTGSDEIAPIRAFDDGQFTYFQFRNKNAEVPAFFLVDREGNESLINFRTRGDFIVVERVGSRFTLRSGSEVTCVYNDARPFSKPLQKSGKPAASAAPSGGSTGGPAGASLSPVGR